MCGGRPSLFAFRKLGGERCSNVVRARLKEYTVVVKGLDTSAAGAESGSCLSLDGEKSGENLKKVASQRKIKGKKFCHFPESF